MRCVLFLLAAVFRGGLTIGVIVAAAPAAANPHENHCPVGQTEEYRPYSYQSGPWYSTVLEAATVHNTNSCQGVGNCETGSPQVVDEAAHGYFLRDDEGDVISYYEAHTRCVDVPSCVAGQEHSRDVWAGVDGVEVADAVVDVNGCEYVQTSPGEVCGGNSHENYYVSNPPEYWHEGDFTTTPNARGVVYYRLQYCSTGGVPGEGVGPGESIGTPPPTPEPYPVPFSHDEYPEQSEVTGAPVSETLPDGTVQTTQTTTTEDDAGSGFAVDSGGGTVSIVEWVDYDNGGTTTTTTTTTTEYPDGTVVVETVENVTEVTPTVTQGQGGTSGVTTTTQTGTTTSTTSTTTTTTAPDGSSSTTTTSGGPAPPGGGEGDGEGEGEGGEGTFNGSGLGGIQTFTESWGDIAGLANTSDNLVGAVAGLADSIPTGGACPTAQMDLPLIGSITVDAHCPVAEQIKPIFYYAFLVGWMMTFLYIVMEI